LLTQHRINLSSPETTRRLSIATAPVEGVQMPRIRRLGQLGVAAVVAALVAACGSSDNGGSSGGGGGSGGSSALEGRGPITFATGKDTSGNLQHQVDTWNSGHPNEKASVIELPESADGQRQAMIQNAQTKSDAYTILNLDVVWTAEFAANKWVLELPKDQFDISAFLPPTVDSASYRDKLYAIPSASDSGLLYYRKDLLDKAGITKPPTTWAELKSDCQKVQATPDGKKVGCYAGQFDKYEGLTCNFAEAVNGAGGVIVGDDGKPNVDTEQAKAGLSNLVDGFKSGLIPKAAITYKEEEGRRAFQAGELIFHRQWPYQYALANKTDGSSKVAGKFAVAALPGLNGPGVGTLGGHNLAISAFAKNKASAADFIKFLTGATAMKANVLATSQAPTRTALYDDPDLQKQYPYLSILKQGILTAKPRPKAVKYGDVTAAIEDDAYAALTGAKSVDDALSNMQSKLQSIIGS
jgi:multiple sugar transport system substrate-binding protein